MNETLLREIPEGGIDRGRARGPPAVGSPGHLIDKREARLGPFSQKAEQERSKESGRKEPHPEWTAAAARSESLVVPQGPSPRSLFFCGPRFENSLDSLSFRPKILGVILQVFRG
jgi:hypothetical protein